MATGTGKPARRYWKSGGGVRPFLIGLATAAVFVSGKLWPKYEVAIWTAFLIAIVVYVYFEVRHPVNYRSIAISEQAIEYVGLGGREVIPFDAIARLEFVREDAVFEQYIESKWMIHTADGKHIEVMDESPHRGKLMRAFRKRLAGFDASAARKGFRAWGKGRWLCYEPPDAGGETIRR